LTGIYPQKNGFAPKKLYYFQCLLELAFVKCYNKLSIFDYVTRGFYCGCGRRIYDKPARGVNNEYDYFDNVYGGTLCQIKNTTAHVAGIDLIIFP